MELLKTYDFEVSPEQLLEIKQLLVMYFVNKAIEEADQLWGEKGWSDNKMKDWVKAK